MAHSWTVARARLAIAVRTGKPPEVVTELRREYAAARLAHLIRATAPQLTAVQRAELAEVLDEGAADA